MHNYNRQHGIKERYIKWRQKQATQLNRIVIVAAAVTMPSARKYGKDRRYLGKRMALLAWKLDDRGTVVDDVVEHTGRRQWSPGLPDNKRGERNNKYTTIIAIQIHGMANAMLTVYCKMYFSE